MMVRSYRDAIGFYLKSSRQVHVVLTSRRSRALKLNVEQLPGILFHKAFNVIGIGLRHNGVKTSVQPVEPAAIVGTENHVVFADLVYQERQCPGIRAGAIDEKMLKKNFRIAPFAVIPFMLPEETMKQERYAAAGAADNDLEIGIAIEQAASDHAQAALRDLTV